MPLLGTHSTTCRKAHNARRTTKTCRKVPGNGDVSGRRIARNKVPGKAVDAHQTEPISNRSPVDLKCQLCVCVCVCVWV